MFRKNAYLKLSTLLFFADDVSPYFKTEPVRTQVHLEGNRLVLTCMAEGSWPLEFKWLHNNRELTKFSLEYRYVLTGLLLLSRGLCGCNEHSLLLPPALSLQAAVYHYHHGSKSPWGTCHLQISVCTQEPFAVFNQFNFLWSS